MFEPLAVVAVGVSKRYGNHEALRGVELIARAGRLHGLLGPNGAGKTTLMRVLLGLVRPDGGSVRILDRVFDPTSGRVPDGVAGFVDTPAFYPYLSGRKNLALMARLDGTSGPAVRKDVERALDRAGLAAQAASAVAGYSMGMRQRLGLAAAMLRSPRVLFLDEPTSSLDPGGARDVRALAKELADQGVAVVWSSHDMTEVEEICDTLTVIDRGQVVFSGTVDQLRQRAPAAVHALLQTSDDVVAYEIAAKHSGVRLAPAADGGFEVSADSEALDSYVIALGGASVAVRVLERRARSLESLFLELTGQGGTEDHPATEPWAVQDARRASLVES